MLIVLALLRNEIQLQHLHACRRSEAELAHGINDDPALRVAPLAVAQLRRCFDARVARTRDLKRHRTPHTNVAGDLPRVAARRMAGYTAAFLSFRSTHDA